jgi:hemoglobin
MSETMTLDDQLGGYDAIAAVADNLVSRLKADNRLGRFWAHRSTDGIRRETQLLIGFLCHSAGGPLFYTGRDMKISHAGMKIDEEDWSALLEHLHATLDHFQVPAAQHEAVVGFVQSTKAEILDSRTEGLITTRNNA